MRVIFAIAILLGLQGLVGCSPNFQTSSGADYLAERKGSTDPDIAKAAAIEPDLLLPARIGFARIVNRGLTAIPPEETESLASLIANHAEMGEFVPVSPLIAEMMGRSGRDTASTIKQIRLTAARQHLDYVVIYEVGARSNTENTPFALADVTLIGGMLLPTRKIKVMGIGQAMFLDVRNAYPYATVSVSTDLTGFARTFNARRASEDLQNRAVAKIVVALKPELDEMLAGITKRASRR